MLVYMVTPIYIGRFINNTSFHPEICPQLSLACSNYSYTLWALKYSLWTPICPSVYRKYIFYCSFDIVWIGKNSHRNTFLHLILSYSNVALNSTVLLTELDQEMSQSDNCPEHQCVQHAIIRNRWRWRILHLPELSFQRAHERGLECTLALANWRTDRGRGRSWWGKAPASLLRGNKMTLRTAI